MKGYVTIPETIFVKPCVECGTRPVIATAGEHGYIVKCLNNGHYQTKPGIIDLEDWNMNNQSTSPNDYNAGLIPAVRR